MRLQQEFELPVNQLQAARDLFAPFRPALAPFLELIFGALLGRPRFVKVVLQSQERFSQT